MVSYGNSEAFLRQLSCGGGGRGGWGYCSSYYENGSTFAERGFGRSKSAAAAAAAADGGRWNRMDEVDAMVAKKRVMVVIDHTARAKQAMMWALTHVANKGDLLALLHVVAGAGGINRGGAREAPLLANALGTLCKTCRPEVEVEALVIEGPMLGTVLSQVRKLEVSVLVLGQGKPSPFCCLFGNSDGEFVDDCINKADCLTVAVRKQSKGVSGYLVSTRRQRNFWLLA